MVISSPVVVVVVVTAPATATARQAGKATTKKTEKSGGRLFVCADLRVSCALVLRCRVIKSVAATAETAISFASPFLVGNNN